MLRFKSLHRHSALLALVALGALVSGCAAEPLDDETDDTSSAASAGKVREGTPEARAVLRFVNNAGEADFDAIRPRLSATVVAKILAYRNGVDGQPQTADDQRFSSIAALDAIPSVGPKTIERLLDAANTISYAVDEFSPDWCEGEPLSAADVKALLQRNSQHWRPFPLAWARARARRNNADAWQEMAPSDTVLQAQGGYLKLEELVGPTEVSFFSTVEPVFRIEQKGFRREWCYGGYPRSCYSPRLDFLAKLDFESGVTTATIGYSPPGPPPAALYGRSTLRVTRSCYHFLVTYNQAYTGKPIEVAMGGRLPW